MGSCLEYDAYLREHQYNVRKAFNILAPEIKKKGPIIFAATRRVINCHDESKFRSDEYEAYADKFYRDVENLTAFNRAWLMHIHRNPHHWQYWVLIEDSGNKEILDMPFVYIVEMVCDWHSFSAEDPTSTAYKFFELNGSRMKLSPKTLKTVNELLEFLKSSLPGVDENYMY